MTRRIGYARVSSESQNLDLQIEALQDCEKIFTDKQSGKNNQRPQLQECLKFLKTGDTLEIWKLSRLGRSASGLLELLQDFRDRGIKLKSHTEGIDTDSAMGRLIYGILGSIAEFEREIIRENQAAGIAAARASGKKWGGKKPIADDKLLAVAHFIQDGKSTKESCKIMDISVSSWYRHKKRIEKLMPGPVLEKTPA
ncbi:MAG: recombinase family protein [Okeania sp. SIO3B5]|uniref:recombinase family protein n=1 Tax=Okeania sp. SIO3B5 TaxID=2607811 RepID=UPI0013FF71D2|nr:recombinase family protein [Okeania sp. SIO3B5]NEO56915.1 recombinase family protein [Okeania sp. SIO3B5]